MRPNGLIVLDSSTAISEAPGASTRLEIAQTLIWKLTLIPSMTN